MIMRADENTTLVCMLLCWLGDCTNPVPPATTLHGWWVREGGAEMSNKRPLRWHQTRRLLLCSHTTFILFIISLLSSLFYSVPFLTSKLNFLFTFCCFFIFADAFFSKISYVDHVWETSGLQRGSQKVLIYPDYEIEILVNILKVVSA